MRRGRPRHPDLLTPREQEALSLLREGLTNEQMATRLGISESGARYHVSAILSKLGVSSRQEAAAWQDEDQARRLRGWLAPLLGAVRLRPVLSRVALTGIATVLVAGFLALALGVAVMNSRASNERHPNPFTTSNDWVTFSNEEFGYEISYPVGWDITVRNTQPGDDLAFHALTLAEPDGPAKVMVAINFQGGWCETGPRREQEAIVVDGERGDEYRCGSDDCILSFVRYFPDVKGQSNYYIGADLHENSCRIAEAVVSEVIRGFRFLN